MFSISGIISLIVAISVAAIIVYYIIYSRHINAKVASGAKNSRHMPDVPNAVHMVFFVALLVYAIIVTCALNRGSNQGVEDNNNSFAVVSLSDYSYTGFNAALVDADASYVRNYSRESNEGYKKSVTQDGDFIFTVFTRNGNRDDFHPDFFCFVDYIGDNNELSCYEYYEFVDMVSMETTWGIGSGGGYIDNSFFIIGNINQGDSFKISLSILDSNGEEAYSEADQKAYEEDKGRFPNPAEYALSSAGVTITVQSER